VRKLFDALFVLVFLLGLASTVAANVQLGARLQVAAPAKAMPVDRG